MSRRGSHAIEFALLLPVFIMLVFGGVELLWYSIEVGKIQSALVAGCRGGAATGINIFTDPFTRAGEYVNETVSRISRFDCMAGDCDIIISESDLSSPEVIWMDCTVHVHYETITNFIPGMPEEITAQSSQPVAQPFEEEYE
tara:strand:- start:300 stop:725 length:426 start_codon:yes stop_codon:yes gene_type:complete